MSLSQRLQNNFFFVINKLTSRVAALEHQVMRMQADLDRQMAIQRQHMVRLKNHEHLPDDFILNGRPYHDLSPEKAWKLFQDPNFDFIFLDVSHQGFTPEGPRPKNVFSIPLEELEARWEEIPNRNTPLLVISEDGLRSILACDYLVSRGMYSCNNISGGWKFWPGHRLHNVSRSEAIA